jgi:sigma-B regulation protein RsbU (phosphoserine phosphatase)
LRFLTRDGGILPVKAVISAIYDSFDDLLGYSLVAHDITEKLALADKNRIIEEQLVFAQRIQLNLMPPARESVPGPFRISSHYQPMEALGGDFYDLIHFSDESSLGIFVSDVSGHGVPAALITSMVKALLTTAGEVRNFPEKMMEYLNHMLMGNMESNFLTAVYGLIESERKTITVARAGHPPAYIIRSDSIEIIAPRGPLLGLMQGDFWKHQTYRFEPGEIYLSFTDGLSEALDQNGQIFEDLLMDILSQRAYCNADELIQVLTDRLNTFTGKRNKQDDKLIVAVEYSPSI